MQQYAPYKSCNTEDASKLQHFTCVALNRYAKNTLTMQVSPYKISIWIIYSSKPFNYCIQTKTLSG